jgi:arsenical pump membrane protein
VDAAGLGALARGDAAPFALARSLQPGFLVFVFGLSVTVAAAGNHGLTSPVQSVLPAGGSLGDLLVIALVSAALANLVNNLPATLILVPVAAGLGASPVLAVLVGVNVGPNLTEVGSLATLLWRRVLRAEGVELRLAEFTRLGLMTVPPGLVAARRCCGWRPRCSERLKIGPTYGLHRSDVRLRAGDDPYESNQNKESKWSSPSP